MNGRVLFLFAFAGATIAACSLNPQPLPPDTFDASKGGGADATSAFGDSGEPAPDSGFDFDAAIDSPSGSIDSGSDAESDAADASESDATNDARDD